MRLEALSDSIGNFQGLYTRKVGSLYRGAQHRGHDLKVEENQLLIGFLCLHVVTQALGRSLAGGFHFKGTREIKYILLLNEKLVK